ncbi:MAG: SDR family oxidoreductase [Polaromonas sp.]|nr:SDR family oxidoreductase [Polaromonas sp.]
MTDRLSTPRVALITGCGKEIGIGSATARELARAGYIVVVSDIQPAGIANDQEAAPDHTHRWGGVESLVDEIVSNGGEASSLIGSVSEEADARRMVADVVRRHGRLDILVNNAGAPHGADRADIEQVPVAAWDLTMAVNLRGVFLMSQAAIAPMRAQKWGRIVNIASAIVSRKIPQRTAYITSKAAVIAFSEALALDVATDGITVNAVCPGSTLTARAMSSARKAGWDDIETGLRERAKGIPMARHAEAGEIASAIAFLVADNSAYVTGTSLFVDGGGTPF